MSPYKDPAERRAHQSAYDAANRKARSEYGREWRRKAYEADPAGYREAERARSRAYRERKKDDPEFQARNREVRRKWEAKNREHLNSLQTKYRNGITPESWAKLWAAQNGMCYLCELPLDDSRNVALDHNHGCCGKDKACPACWRGLAHKTCNSLIGLANDDPGRLRRIADNLESVKNRRAPEAEVLF